MNTDAPHAIAARAAREVPDGALVNLGIGIPLLIPQYLPEGVRWIVHQESGYVGMGPAAQPGAEDETLTDAAGNHVTLLPGASCFDSATSFALVRGGRLDVVFLGALEVDAEGSLANWIVPGKWSPGIGGAMELAQKARTVVVTTRHVGKDGQSKIRSACSLPVTAPRCVSTIITERAVLRVERAGVLRLIECADGVSVEALRECTDAPFEIDPAVIPAGC